MPADGRQEAEMRFGTATALLGLFLAASGCADLAKPVDYVLGDALLGLGDDCTEGDLVCEEGLVCAANGTCQEDGSDGTTPEDGDCFSSAYCAYGLVCASDGTCQPPGDPGTGDSGADCEDDEDCVFGLECLDGACVGFQIPYWPGVACQDPAEYDDEFRAFFDVKGYAGDFYALPFPNDIRRQGGHLDLSDHPNPGVIIPELGNPVDDFIEMLEEDIDGFGTNSCAYFRFTRPIATGSIVNMENVFLIDVTPTSDRYGEQMANGYDGSRSRGRYICPNWYVICPSLGRPLKPGTTYAAVFLDTVEDEEGNTVDRDPYFEDMIAPNPPADTTLEDAYDAYAPLRDYLDDDSIAKPVDEDNIAVAAVFTTQTSIWDVIPNVRTAVLAETAPAVEDLSIDTSGGAYDLYTGTVTIPFFQDGERPFRTVADGGAITYDDDGLPIAVEEESVEFALTVPAGTPPVDGWPIMIFAHGTGGSELSFTQANGMEASVADRMAALGVAVIGIEQVQHGDRRGLSGGEADLEANSPERLFYNFLNPRAARDNNVQAAADHFQLVRLIQDFAAISETSVSFDADSVMFLGHSQGSQGPLLFAAHEPAVTMVVLSGAGGSLIDSFVEKQNPLDIASAIKVLLADPDVDTKHPLLNLIQAGLDNVDPVNHAPAVFRSDWSDYLWPAYPHRHVFMSYGVGDTYTPEPTQLALAKSLWVDQWPLDPDDPLPSIDVIESLPCSGTKAWFGDDITAVVVQYEPPKNASDEYIYDGHFVMFQHPDAISQLDSFVSTYLADGLPSLLEP
jgi:predicted esterase